MGKRKKKATKKRSKYGWGGKRPNQTGPKPLPEHERGISKSLWLKPDVIAANKRSAITLDITENEAHRLAIRVMDALLRRALDDEIDPEEALPVKPKRSQRWLRDHGRL